MHLIELYKSVQGESTFAGLPCIFVRFAGCNLRCAWCDSEYTFTGGKPFTADEIVAADRGPRPLHSHRVHRRRAHAASQGTSSSDGAPPRAELHADDRDLRRAPPGRCPQSRPQDRRRQMPRRRRRRQLLPAGKPRSPHQKRRSQVRHHQPRRLRFRPQLHPRTRARTKRPEASFSARPSPRPPPPSAPPTT